MIIFVRGDSRGSQDDGGKRDIDFDNNNNIKDQSWIRKSITCNRTLAKLLL